MKKLFQILFLVQCVLMSCNKKSEKNVGNEKNVVEKSLIKDESITGQTEIDMDSTKTRAYAELILKNEVNPSDDDKTVACIEQMFTKNKNNLEFYFKTFRVIVEKSDGALSEAIGIEIMRFIKYNPDFFLDKYSEFEFEEKQRFIQFMAYEFYFTEPNHNAEIDRYFAEVSALLKENTELKMKALNSIRELTKIETEQIINN